MAAMSGCDPSSTTGGDTGVAMDAEPQGDDTPAPFDAGLPETCSTPGEIDTVACGLCGTVERFCTASGTWAYGECMGESGMCLPGTTESIACGNCGEQMARCTASCTWETTGACTDEGECAPGVRTRGGGMRRGRNS